MATSDKEIPWIINLELTNLCQLECVFCDHPVLKKKMRLGCMESVLLCKILLDVERSWSSKKIHELGLVGLGEPTLDTDWIEHLEIISRYSHLFDRISLNSNLVSLTAQKTEEVLDSAVNVFTFSINASDRSHYLGMMGIDQFDKVVKNLKYFLEAMRRHGKDISVGVQVLDSDHSSVEKMAKLFPKARDQGVNFFSRKVYSKPILWQGTNLVNLHSTKDYKRYPCWDIYTRIYIDIDGFLYPCTIGNDSYRNDSELCLGNVLESSINDLFNGQRNQEARALFENGKLAYSECENCNVWSLTPNNFEWDDKQNKWLKKTRRLRAFGLKEQI